MATLRVALLVLLFTSMRGLACGQDAPPPIRVFILAGQSNMQGHGFIAADDKRNGGRGSLEFLVKNLETADRFRHLVDAFGKWKVRDDVWISYLDRRGPLTVGFGANPELIGPELGFGRVVGDAYSEPVVLIKCAWGGKSLAVDFRPPSAGPVPYTLGPKLDADVAADPTIVGKYYRETVTLTRDALGKLSELAPGLAGRPYVLSGFGWHQGWNDRINDKFNAEYESNLTHFIRDIRRDLHVEKLPFVIAETGMSGPEEKHPRALSLMKAQAAVADLPEFAGNVAFVGTKSFWRPQDQSPNKQDYHWNSNAESYYLIGEAMGEAIKQLSATKTAEIQKGEMAGYLIIPNEKVPDSYNAGFSIYVAAWPLQKEYPGSRFQSGLFGTWMFAKFDGAKPERLYSDVEGGLGWWRDTRFATETPKFIMGGVAPNFSEWANGPGAGKGRDWNKPSGKYGIAQLSPWLLWPPDGLNLKQGTCGELFGFGYLPLPLTSAKSTTSGKDVPTGDNSWTLFLNTGNFKGPVAFFTPFFWSRAAVDESRFNGLLLDSRGTDPNRQLQMETQFIPAVQATDSRGETYARIAPTCYPRAPSGDAPLVHRISSYKKAALWDGVKAWFDGGKPSTGAIDPEAAIVHKFTGRSRATWRIYSNGTPKEKRILLDWDAFATPTLLNPHTFAYHWNDAIASPSNSSLVSLPHYFHLVKGNVDQNEHWAPVLEADVPDETGLKQSSFKRSSAPSPEPYVTPAELTSCWKTPGPVAGPFQARLGDGSVVTYHWYRFADQPALLNADLTDQQREELQSRVKLLHREWTKDRDYLPPPTVGSLADLDPALIVTPPAGMEAGYVPIVTRQAATE